MVIVEDVELYSVREHHMLPFWAKAHIASASRMGYIVGLSKLASRWSMCLQDACRCGRMTTQILGAITRNRLQPLR